MRHSDGAVEFPIRLLPDGHDAHEARAVYRERVPNESATCCCDANAGLACGDSSEGASGYLRDKWSVVSSETTWAGRTRSDSGETKRLQEQLGTAVACANAEVVKQFLEAR